jgi:hypothetical protein
MDPPRWPATLNRDSRFLPGVVVGRIFLLAAVGPKDRRRMWASGHTGEIRRAAHGYAPTREAAMATCAKSLGDATRAHSKNGN